MLSTIQKVTSLCHALVKPPKKKICISSATLILRVIGCNVYNVCLLVTAHAEIDSLPVS